VLWQNANADLPGCHAYREGENDRSLITSDEQNPTAQPGTDCQIEFRLIHVHIGSLVYERGFSTIIKRAARWGCRSACPLIWFAGRHATIQRNSLLIFHVASDERTQQVYPNLVFAIANYLQSIGGLTARQANFLANAAPPEGGWIANEANARGFDFRYIPSLLAGRNCQTRFCVSVP
jgi:hypothetical protein